tara:strand:- start:20664 stop:21227 length:564 start_codon:yes stop_codon:yes gene_type:complete
MSDAPVYLQDAKDLLSDDGFAVSGTWYHGTSSALWESIQKHGLKRSGDKDLKQATKKTMATIGNHYTETIEPVFLCPSKELAYYWAQQRVSERNSRFEGAEEPIVIEVRLPSNSLSKVKPDVGAMSLLLLEGGERYLAFLAKIAQNLGLTSPNIDLQKADRMEYLEKLGMAYIDENISASDLSLLVG